MNETIKGWLKELYEGEIEETKGTIGNERIWANGAPDAETAAMHEENVRVEEEYLKILEEKLDELTENTCADGEGNPNWPACADCGKRLDPESDDLHFADNGKTPLCRACYAERQRNDEDTALRDPEDFERKRATTLTIGFNNVRSAQKVVDDLKFSLDWEQAELVIDDDGLPQVRYFVRHDDGDGEQRVRSLLDPDSILEENGLDETFKGLYDYVYYVWGKDENGNWCLGYEC